jgi:hypothetical protein
MYYQPNWKESLHKLESFTEESVDNINSTLFLLSRCSDDVAEVRVKAKQILEDKYSGHDFNAVCIKLFVCFFFFLFFMYTYIVVLSSFVFEGLLFFSSSLFSDS